MGTGAGDLGQEALLLELLRQQGFAVDGSNAPAPRASTEAAPAGPAQRRFWLQEQVDPTPGLNNLGCLLRFDAPLDRPALERALAALTARHEVLRSRYEARGESLLEIVEEPGEAAGPPALERLAADDAESLACFVEAPYALERAPLWRVAAFDAPAAADCLLLGCHHAILDWTGLRLLLDELARLYEAERAGRPATLPAPALQQADHAAWLAGAGRRARRERDRAYWRERLAGPLPTLALPAARAEQAGLRWLGVPVELDAALSAEVRRFAAARGTTAFVVLLAAYASVLGRFALAEELCLGAAVDNRDGPGAEAIVGCLTDMLVLRCDLSGRPGFGALVERLHRACAEDFGHAGLGFAELVELLRPERRPGVAPLYQAIFNLLPAAPERPAAGRPEVTPLASGVARADLALELREQGDRLAGRLEVREGLLAPAVAEALGAAIPTLLRHGLAAPGRPAEALPLIEPEAGAALLDRLNPPLPAPPATTLHELVVERAESRPEAIALIEPGATGERRLTFGDLLARSAGLAARLLEAGLEPGRPVALCLPRSLELAVAFLATLRAGGVALPLDPAYPGPRLAGILADSGARLMIAGERPAWLPEDGACRVLSPEPPAAERPSGGRALPRVGPEAPACLVYTSGSTGRPKGVTGLHRGIVNRLLWMERAFPFGAEERGCQKTSPGFVDFLAELFGPLAAGIPSVIVDAATARDPAALTALIRDRGVTRVVLVPSLLHAWLDGLPDLGKRLAGLRLCVSSGEPLPPPLAARFKEALPGCRLLNLYGSSEVSADATWHEACGRERGRMPLGRPIPGNRVAVVDAAGQPLPPGAPGEILVGGHGVAAGYWNDPAQTAARFGAFGPGPAEAPRFRSGDLAFWDDEGRLAPLGRADRQAKIAGVRVEPGEVEAALLAHPEVAACHVRARPDGERAALVAYIAGGRAPDAAGLRAFLAERLPPALLPEAFVFLERLPLNANGKIDAAALPAPAPEAPGHDGRRAELDPLEQLVAEAWGSVLERAPEAAEADFFRLGGSSLQAILAMGRLGEALGRTLPVAWLFETPRLDALARRLANDEGEREALPPPTPEAAATPAPASANQAWLWEEYRRDPARVAYTLTVGYRLDGALDARALAAALGAMVARHESLRTRLEETPTGLVQRVDPAPEAPLARRDLSDAPDPEAAFRAAVAAAGRRPFALDREAPFRAELLRLGPQAHGLLLSLHHAASDGASGQLLVEELARLYRAELGLARAPAAPALQGGDLGRWQQRIRPLLTPRLEHYRRALAGAEAPRLAGLTGTPDGGGPVGIEPVPLGAALFERFRRLGSPGRSTPFLLLLAAWAALLARFGDCERPLLATPLSGRGVPGLRELVAFLANPVLLAVDLSGAPSFEQAVEAARRALLQALGHQEVPLSWIQASGAGWPADDGALRSMLILEDARAWDLALPELDCRLAGVPGSPEARSDLALVVSDTHAGPLLRLEYAERRVPPALARRLARGLAALVEGAVADPATPLDRLPLRRDGDEAALADAPAAPAPAAGRLDALLARRAAERPAEPAARDGGLVVSWAELERQVAGLAGRLQALGVGAGDRVGLVAAASPRQLAGLLAVGRAGATAVPLDPSYPAARLVETLADAGVAAALAERPLDYPCPQLRLDEASADGAGPAEAPDGEAPAAVIYTSGTSGRPKGVPLAQDALCRLGAALAEAYGLAAGDRVLQVVSPGFDVALSDVAMALSAGASLVLPPREARLPGRSLRATLEREAVTHLQAPAAVLAATAPGPLPALRVVAVGGEVCPPETARRWAEGRRLFVAYGPSEATVTAALGPLDGAARLGTIGRPFCGARLAVRDAAGALLPPGVPGELEIAGPNVAPGYLGRPELTAERFLPDEEAGPEARRYRTGDRVRLEDDGSFSFLGRLDRQVKLRGFRIEPGETEAALMALPGVARALAEVRADRLGERRLVAWIEPAAGAEPEPARLRRALAQRLPDQLVPAAIALIEAVPLTGNGKVDWAALPTPAAPAARAPVAPAPAAARPSGGPALRRELAALWQALLDRPEGAAAIGLDQSFFDIGGHSLLVVRLQDALAERFGVELPVGELFAHPTLRSLAGLLERRSAAPARAAETEDFTL